MNLDIRVLDSAAKHIKGKEELINCEDRNIVVAKEEHFGFQILIHADFPFFCSLEKTHDIHWTGLGNRVRIDIPGYEEIFNMNFLGYVESDDGSIIADPILKEKSIYIEKGYQMIWIDGKIPKDFPKDDFQAKIKVYHSKGYEREELIEEKDISIRVLNYVVKSIKEGPFYLDLWQHPCSWARAYEVEYFSDKHFEIIDNYIEALSNLGQRVIDLIVTDYPWAGQRCFQFTDNPSNLFELNIVNVKKDKEGEIYCDFTALDRYIDICTSHGIDEEINIFGILGNWDYELFGSPMTDYNEAIRIRYYDEKSGTYDFFRSSEEFKDYLSILFKHLINKGLWHKVKIMCDQPEDVELFKERINFITSSIPGYEINLKAAINDQEFFEVYGKEIQSISLNTCELVKNIDKLSKTRQDVINKKGRFTWYSCCFPEELNIFIKSPLIESRLKGWFTYYWGFDGLLRWAYAIWTSDPLKDIRYKYPKWNAGDMLLVYPGKDLKPMSSVREKNLLYGIQDFHIFKELEENGISNDRLVEEMALLLGKKEKMEFILDRNVKLNHSLKSSDYIKFRNDLIENILAK